MDATPAWINSSQGVALNPPAEVLALGEMPRAPEKLLAVSTALRITSAKRYQPGGGVTWCNIAVSDGTTILRKPLPHRFDLGDGKGFRELRANDIVDGLRALKFPNWEPVGSLASKEAVKILALDGRPQVAVWKNMAPVKDSAGRVVIGKDGKPLLSPGHVMLVMPAPNSAPPKPGFSGIYVSGAGAQCLHQCPVELGFGSYTSQVEFYAADE